MYPHRPAPPTSARKKGARSKAAPKSRGGPSYAPLGAHAGELAQKRADRTLSEVRVSAEVYCPRPPGAVKRP